MLKKLLIGLAAVVVLVIAVAIAVPFFVSVDSIRDKVVASVKSSTGRDLKIDGPVKFSVLPTLGLELTKVSFSNAAGASAPQMMTLAKLEVALKLFPLISGDLEIDRFVLNDPVIALEVDKQGRPNWQFAEAQAAAAPRQPAQGNAKVGSALSQLRLDDVRLVNGKLSYLDQRTGQKQELSDVNLKVSLPGLDNPFAAEGAVTWRGKQVKTTVNVASLRALMDGKTSDVAVKVASEPISFDYKGKVTNANPLKVDGPIDLKVPSVRGLAAWTGNPLQMPGDKTFQAMEIKGTLAMAGSKIGFTGAELSFDAIKAKGDLAFDGSGAKPYLQGKLDLDKLDVNPYLPPEAPAGAKPAGGAGGAAAAKSSGWSDDPIDVAPLRIANADFALTVGSILMRKIQVGPSALGLQLKDGRLTADLSKLTLYQGSGQGKFVVDGSGSVPGVDINFKLANLQAEPLLKDAAGFDRMTGTGAFDVAVAGRGHSQREIVGTLNGKGGMNFANGTIKGVNLGTIAKAAKGLTSGNPVSIAQSLEGAVAGAVGGSQQTEFSSLTSTYAITNGILKNQDLDLKSPVVHATGAGTADMPHRTVDYKLIVTADSTNLPVLVTGPWDNLSYKPDVSALLAGGAGKALQDLGKGLLGGGASSGASGTPASKPGQIPGADSLKSLFGGRK
jgi:AsmA protein